MRILSIIPVILFTLLSCGQEAQYASCPMPSSMADECKQLTMDNQCKNLGVKCRASCIVEDHPECKNNPCLEYNYKDPVTGDQAMTPPFCTKECKPDANGKSAECGDNALCLPYLDKNYCIPLEYVTSKK